MHLLKSHLNLPIWWLVSLSPLLWSRRWASFHSLPPIRAHWELWSAKNGLGRRECPPDTFWRKVHCSPVLPKPSFPSSARADFFLSLGSWCRWQTTTRGYWYDGRWTRKSTFKMGIITSPLLGRGRPFSFSPGRNTQTQSSPQQLIFFWNVPSP